MLLLLKHVTHSLDGSPYMFWEFKNHGGDIFVMVSFGLSYRCHKKTGYKIVLVAITPYNLAYAVLPPFFDPLKDIAFMSQKVYQYIWIVIIFEEYLR